MENIRNCSRLDFNRKYVYRKIIKQQYKLTFSGIHKSYESCVSYSFKQIEVLMGKPVYLRFAVLDLSKTLTYETN